jgi:lactate dehydrogenase-like 2-hydroxyacid dehydrogenase
VSKKKLLYYEVLQYHPSVLALMNEKFEVVSLPDPAHDTDEVLERIDVSLAPLGFPFDKSKIDRCPSLRVIGSSTLSVPHIDLDHAATKGIKVCWLSEEHKAFLNTITPTAELTWGLIIAITRKIPWAHNDVCSGNWEGRSFGKQTSHMLSNMSLGIIGLGRLGELVACYGKAFGMDVYYFSPTSTNPEYKRCDTLLELAAIADIVSIHAHHTPDTERMIGSEFFTAMKSGSYLVNTARGAIVDENALLEALDSGHLAGAALDVYADEYKSVFVNKLGQSPIVKYAKMHDNLILTPHYAGATVDAWERTQTKIIEIIHETID